MRRICARRGPSDANLMRSPKVRQSGGARPPYREALLPLLYRRLSFAYYSRSERYARHCARVWEQGEMPVPSLVQVLSVYLSQRLPARLVSRLGITGLRRCAKLLVAASLIARFLARPWIRLVRWGCRLLNWLRAAAANRSQTGEEVVGTSRASR
jgi:hypothetical protein